MIVRVNGGFGSGKTTLVAELHRRRPETLVFDPEHIGFVLREIVDVPTGNFQDLPLWRRQVASMAVGLVREYERSLLVPMALVDTGYLSEIVDTVHAAGITVRHFYLDVPLDVLARRIDARSTLFSDPERAASQRTWAATQNEVCAATRTMLPADTVVLDGCRPTAELADEVMARTAAGRGEARPVRR